MFKLTDREKAVLLKHSGKEVGVVDEYGMHYDKDGNYCNAEPYATAGETLKMSDFGLAE